MRTPLRHLPGRTATWEHFFRRERGGHWVAYETWTYRATGRITRWRWRRGYERDLRRAGY